RPVAPHQRGRLTVPHERVVLDPRRHDGSSFHYTGAVDWAPGGRSMRPNRLKAKLREGRRAVGVLLTLQSAELVELFGHLGYDFVFLDAQHGGLTVETARDLIRAAELTGMTPLVRVPRNDPSVILEYLDVGAAGIIVPNIPSRATAEAAVQAIKYPPRGARGASTLSRAAFYGVTQPAADYLR